MALLSVEEAGAEFCIVGGLELQLARSLAGGTALAAEVRRSLTIHASQYPEHHRGLANALIDAGTKTGPAIGTLVGGLLVSQLGWRPFFLVLGLGSMLWLIPWSWWRPRGKGVSAHEDRTDIASIGDILRQRSAWFSAFGLFCSNYFWYFLITWLPAYLEKERHFPKSKMAVPELPKLVSTLPSR